MRPTCADKALAMLSAVAVAAFCLHAFSDNKADVDLWGNVGFVKAPAWSPDFHLVNTFSFTDPDREWINHEWLSQYLFHLTYAHFGDTGLLLLKVLLGLSITVIIASHMRRECNSAPVRFFLIILVVSTMGYGFSVRPHLFTYLLYAALLATLKRWPASARHLFIAAPIAGLVWTNLHGAFFIGLLAVILYTASLLIFRRQNDCRHLHIVSLAIVAGVFAATSLLNPYGVAIWRFIAQSAALPRPWLSEWAPFNPLEHSVTNPDFLALALISAVLVAASRRREWQWIAILSVAFVGALVLRRNIPLFAITAAFVLPRHAEEVAGPIFARFASAAVRTASAACLILFSAACIWGFLSFNKDACARIEIEPDRFPAEVIAFVRDEGISGNALVFFDWAEYSIWQNYPACRQFMDGRFSDAYSRQTIDDYFNFLYLRPGSAWDNALTKYPTDILMLHNGNPACSLMRNTPDWTLVAESDIAALFLKNTVHSEVIRRLQRSGPLPIKILSTPTFFPGEIVPRMKARKAHK